MVEEGKEPTTPEGYWHFVLDPMNTFYCRVLRQVSGAPSLPTFGRHARTHTWLGLARALCR